MPLPSSSPELVWGPLSQELVWGPLSQELIHRLSLPCRVRWVQSDRGWSRDDLRGARQLARATALQPCIRRIAEIPTHDADIRIGG